MNDEKIIQLYWDRDEQAIQASMDTYGPYCRAVAREILHNPSDEEEAVADTWLKAWDAIPPSRPQYLRLFLGKLTRNISLSLWRRQTAFRRGGGQVTLALEELGECIGAESSLEEQVNMRELEKALSAFLRMEPDMRRNVFLHRYFYLEDIAAIARRYELRESNVRMMLSRTRQKLKKFLIQEGYIQ